MAKIINIPYNFKPRDYQRRFYNSIEDGYRRGVAIWHRRAGKDKTFINLVSAQMQQRVGSYYYFFPTYKQGRKILWNGMDRRGFRFLDHIPKALRKTTNNVEMTITMHNGSLFQVVGSDNIDSIVGTNPVGCVYSEYALQSPLAWDFMRPVLLENDGWALFNYTPRGQNHGYDMYVRAKESPHWYCELQNITHTGVFTPEDIEREVEDGMDPELAQQEYYCSFEAAVPGAYYGSYLRDARNQGRICKVPHYESVPVDIAWDIGVGDSTAIWFWQLIQDEIHWIDYYENSGEGLDHYVQILLDKMDKYNYHYGKVYAPHDFFSREFGTGVSPAELAKKNHGINAIQVAKLKKDPGIQAVRTLFPRMWFDEVKCKQGIACIMNYHKGWDEKNRVFRLMPVHDWSSHGADSFRYACLGIGNQKGLLNDLNLDRCAA